MRAVSTVLDATLCLLLVSASVLTLAGTPLAGVSSPTGTADTADEIAAVLATSTARVTYEAEPRNRTAHDTLAGLLASAARADANASATPAFVRAVIARVTRALGRAGAGVQVVANATPRHATESHEDSDASRVVAGSPPPQDADVHAATFAVRRVRLTVRTWSR